MTVTVEAQRAPLRPSGAVGDSTSAKGSVRPVAPSRGPVAAPSRLNARGPMRRSLSTPGRPPRGSGVLTRLELEIVNLVSLGATSARMARDLHVTPDTVDTHLKRIFKKLRVTDRASMVAAGFRLGLLTPRPLRPGVVVPDLPPKQAEVVPLLAEGLTNAAIGARLGLSSSGANERLKALYRRLGVGSREHAVRVAVEAGYLSFTAVGESANA